MTKANQGRLCTKPHTIPFPFLYFQPWRSWILDQLWSMLSGWSWGHILFRPQTLLTGKQRLAKTYTSNSSKEVTEDKSHHHSHWVCWCIYFYIHSPQIYHDAMGTDSLHHPELCNKEAACLRCNFTSHVCLACNFRLLGMCWLESHSTWTRVWH